ncbi:MAG TPA: hypothetical protein VL551_11880 [Actinospica sp.]|jgi:hypothetical protein|nr:hypothetical protein [Actinospica sp.]
MRVYLPATMPLLARLSADGELRLPDGFAVTPSLRDWYTDGDEEELEYAALTAAARASLRRLAAEPDAARRRVVIASDIPDGRIALSDGAEEPGVIKITGSVRLVDVASLHVDEAGAQEHVTAAARALSAADAGDPDAVFTVDAVEDYDLLWFAAQELGDLL